MAAGVAGDDQLQSIGKCAAHDHAVAVKVANTSPASKFQTFSVLSSQEAETARCKSGVNATTLNAFKSPVRVRSSRPLLNFHTFSVVRRRQTGERALA